jgi:pimeloyl-ACP methyl ester carboxylesterase
MFCGKKNLAAAQMEVVMTSRRAVLLALAGFIVEPAATLVRSRAEDKPPLPAPRPPYAPKGQEEVVTGVKMSVTVPTPPPGGYKRGRIIILRGLQNIWSRGMDQLAKKFEAQGVKSVILDNHVRWQKIANDAIADYKKNKDITPIIIIGHSLGGDAALVMSNWMVQNGVPVRLIVVFDAVADTHPLEGGIQEVINFYKPHGYGREVIGNKRFTGTITNVDLTERKDIGHLNIDENQTLQDEVLAKSLTILKETQMASR